MEQRAKKRGTDTTSIQSWKQLHALCSTNPQRVIDLLRQWESEGVQDESLQFNKAGLLIDAGNAACDADVINQGVSLLESQLTALRGQGQEPSAQQWFNLGNGYYAAEAVRRAEEGYVYNPSATPMSRAKECYRNAWALVQEKPVDDTPAASDEFTQEVTPLLKAEILINLGNSLDEIGRSLEAIDFYEDALRIDPDHPIALMRLGKALFLVSNWIHNRQMLRDAREALKKALKGRRLETYGYSTARSGIIEDLEKTRNVLRAVGRRKSKHVLPLIAAPYNQQFVDFCVQRRLFLNYSLPRHPSPHPYQDHFRFSVVTPLSDETMFARLTRLLNEFTERFATARLLLFEAYLPPASATFYDTVTPYIDLGDAAQYGVRAGKLKLAFESAYNVLDKMALFLNEYFEWGIPKKQVSFATIWSEKSNLTHPPLRETILQQQNNFVFALYDLSRDFGKNAEGKPNEWAHYRATRHLLTHQYLVLHAYEWRWQIVDGPEYHREWEVMISDTTSLVYLTRNALLYLFWAVELEEARRAQHKDQSRVHEHPYHLHEPDIGLI